MHINNILNIYYIYKALLVNNEKNLGTTQTDTKPRLLQRKQYSKCIQTHEIGVQHNIFDFINHYMYLEKGSLSRTSKKTVYSNKCIQTHDIAVQHNKCDFLHITKCTYISRERVIIKKLLNKSTVVTIANAFKHMK